MANINISEADFMALAYAANLAKDDGDMVQAEALDKVARKMNAALSNGSSRGYRMLAGGQRKPLTWKDVPSTLIELKAVGEF